tara:strand:+ start:76 stop:408 length:333 start_codon:yes stop_codon:yes gene_type:complete
MERDAVNMLVAQNIQTLMEKKGMDAAKLARAAAINPTGVYYILKGKSRSPKVETISKIAQGLGVPVAFIFSERLSDDIEADLLAVYEQLSPEKRKLLMQTALAWLPDSSS